MQKTIYRFSNLSDADMKDEKPYLDFSNNQPSPESRFSERGFMRGKLLEENRYNSKNALTESVAYHYRDKRDIDSLYTLTSNLCYGNNGCSASFGYYGGGIYKLYYPQYDAIEKEVTSYASGNAPNVTTTTKYTKFDTLLKLNFPYAHMTNV